MSLLDQIKNKLAEPTQSAATAAGGQAETIRGLLRAKTGKAQTVGAGSPRATGIQERIAAQTTQAGQAQLAEKGKLQAEQFEQRELDIGQKAQQQQQQFVENLKSLEQDTTLRINSLLDEYNQGQRRLDTQQDIAKLEQIGFGLRLQNEQYIQTLLNEGQKKRLDNSLEFKKELAKTVFQDKIDLFKNELAFNQMLAADRRQFAEELAQMDLGYAMQVAEEAARATSAQQAATGISQAVSGSIQAYGMFNSKSGTKDRTTTGEP